MCCEVPPYRCKSRSKRRERWSKTMKKWVETSGKIGGYVAVVGEFENKVEKSLGPRKRAPKNSENLFFEKNRGKCVWVVRCCRIDVK